MPARYRDDLQTLCAGRLTVTKHPHGCLMVFPRPVLGKLPRPGRPAAVLAGRRQARVPRACATTSRWDATSRVLIRPELRTWAGLEKDVTLLGMGSRFELWATPATPRTRRRVMQAQARAALDNSCSEHRGTLGVAHHRPAPRSDRRARDGSGRHLRRRHLRPRRAHARAAVAPGPGRARDRHRPRSGRGRGGADGADAIADPRFEIVHASFAQLPAALAERGIGKITGLLLDLGVSSPQIDTPERGFSFRFDGPLDMRMDTTRGETAADFLARADERQIAEVIRDYGEERFAVSDCKGACCSSAKAARPCEPLASCPPSWLVRSRPASRARTLQRARFRLFGFSSMPSLRSSNRS